MCVICIKPKGVAMPPEVWIENMWYSNPDGAGFMYADGKKVVINKGYMELDSFMAALDLLKKEHNLQDLPLIMHFRIGTAGGNIPANTHPFPISDSISVLQKLVCTTKLGIVHNGIIPVTPRQKDISDTMEYIAAQLSPLYRYDHEFYRSKDILQMIGNATTSKLAFLNPAGEIFTVGTFTEDGGCMFSNFSYASSYVYRRTPVRYYGTEFDDLDESYGWYLGSQGQYCADLMMLCDNEFIIDNDTGDFYEADDYILFMDRTGFLYGYDEYEQACYELTGNLSIYNCDGSVAYFDEEKACAMLIISDEDMDFKDFVYCEGLDKYSKVNSKSKDKEETEKKQEKEEPKGASSPGEDIVRGIFLGAKTATGSIDDNPF